MIRWPHCEKCTAQDMDRMSDNELHALADEMLKRANGGDLEARKMLHAIEDKLQERREPG